MTVYPWLVVERRGDLTLEHPFTSEIAAGIAAATLNREYPDRAFTAVRNLPF